MKYILILFMISCGLSLEVRAEESPAKVLVVQRKSENGLEQLSLTLDKNEFQIVVNTGAFQLGQQRLGVFKLLPTKGLTKEFAKLYDKAAEEPPVESGPHEWTLLVNGKPLSQDSPHLGHTVSMIRRSLETAQMNDGAVYDKEHPPKCLSQSSPSAPQKKAKTQSTSEVTFCATKYGTVYLPLMQ